MDRISFDHYLKGLEDCQCGRSHSCNIDKILIEENALERLPEIIAHYGYRNICVIEDVHTEKAAGESVCALLDADGSHYARIVFQDDFLIPDEAALGRILMETDGDCDLILAVGSGTLNDICKFISARLHIDYFVIATAPSMDGFASNVAALITNHAKITYEAGMPRVIIGDLSVLSDAPMDMIAAGVGDILGKYVCLMDWKLSAIINREYYCEVVAGLIRMSIEKVLEALGDLRARSHEAVCSIMEGLVLSGIAMSYIGNSRPASGSEHHISHYWEMMALTKGGRMELHGTKVAIGTVIGLKMYERLIKTELTGGKGRLSFDREAWQQEMARVYGKGADSVIALEDSCHKNAVEKAAMRRKSLIENRAVICEEASKLPKPEAIMEILKNLGAKYLPKQAGVEDTVLRDSILYAKELRNRYGILQVWYDLDLQEQVAEEIIEYFKRQTF